MGLLVKVLHDIALYLAAPTVELVWSWENLGDIIGKNWAIQLVGSIKPSIARTYISSRCFVSTIQPQNSSLPLLPRNDSRRGLLRVSEIILVPEHGITWFFGINWSHAHTEPIRGILSLLLLSFWAFNCVKVLEFGNLIPCVILAVGRGCFYIKVVRIEGLLSIFGTGICWTWNRVEGREIVIVF